MYEFLSMPRSIDPAGLIIRYMYTQTLSSTRPSSSSVQAICEPMPTWAVRAGARKQVYFEPSAVTAAIVTCGGLCPGLNDVVQGLVQKLTDYGVTDGNILGIKCESRLPYALPS